MWILHFFPCYILIFPNCLVTVKTTSIVFEGRQRQSVMCVSAAEMLHSSGYSHWELWDSLISFCASSVTLKCALQEHESSHSDRDLLSGVHTVNSAGGWSGGHYSSTLHCRHCVQRSNNSTNSTNSTSAVACFSSESQPRATCCHSRIFANFKLVSEMICCRSTRGQVPALMSLCRLGCEGFLSE